VAGFGILNLFRNGPDKSGIPRMAGSGIQNLFRSGPDKSGIPRMAESGILNLFRTVPDELGIRDVTGIGILNLCTLYSEECQEGKHIVQHFSADSIIVAATGLGLTMGVLGSIVIIRARERCRAAANSH
jgi:hypothetical protein